jgi:hypothetical protein
VETTASPDEAAAVAARLERFAGAIPGRILRPGDSQQPLLDELVGQIGGELQRISAEMAAARRVRHKTEVDDPESGEVLRVCGGFGRRLVDRYRRQVVAAAAPSE